MVEEVERVQDPVDHPRPTGVQRDETVVAAVSSEPANEKIRVAVCLGLCVYQNLGENSESGTIKNIHTRVNKRRRLTGHKRIKARSEARASPLKKIGFDDFN